MPAFIAANYIMNYYCEHNICPMRTKLPVVTDTVMVNQDLHIDQIEAYCHVDRDAIKALNPQYRTDVIPGKSAPRILRLPQEAILLFVEKQDSIYNYRRSELITRRGTVKVKDTPEDKDKGNDKKVAAPENDLPIVTDTPREVKPVKEVKEVTPVKEVKENRSAKEQTSSRDKREQTSSRDRQASSRDKQTSSRDKQTSSRDKQTSSRNDKKSSKKKTSSKPRSVTVKSGDNLTVIAARNGTTVTALKKANGLKSDKLKPGQALKLK